MVVQSSKNKAREGNLVWVSMLGADDKAKPCVFQKDPFINLTQYDSWGNYTAGPNDLDEVFKLPNIQSCYEVFWNISINTKSM